MKGAADENDIKYTICLVKDSSNTLIQIYKYPVGYPCIPPQHPTTENKQETRDRELKWTIAVGTRVEAAHITMVYLQLRQVARPG